LKLVKLMRSNYNILWLDDDFEDDTSFLKRLVSKTEKYLKEKGYIPKIIKVSNKADALQKISCNIKIDLFLSDYNISEDNQFSGFDFLIETRKYYRQEMLLYSNQDEQQLKNHIIDYLSEDSTPLEYFSKFVFKSATDALSLLNSIKSIIDLTLIRWNELNALRGLYPSETGGRRLWGQSGGTVRLLGYPRPVPGLWRPRRPGRPPGEGGRLVFRRYPRRQADPLGPVPPGAAGGHRQGGQPAGLSAAGGSAGRSAPPTGQLHSAGR